MHDKEGKLNTRNNVIGDTRNRFTVFDEVKQPLKRLEKTASYSNSSILRREKNGETAENHKVQPKLQTTLALSRPSDKYELEADQVADQILRNSGSASQPTNLKKYKKGVSTLRSTEDLRSNNHALYNFGELINPIKIDGRSLPRTTRTFFEAHFGIDFSRVRIHTDAGANKLCSRINADAFTVGQNIFFRQGAYDYGSFNGQKLIAHELTHVVQQESRKGLVRGLDGCNTSLITKIPVDYPLIQRHINIEEGNISNFITFIDDIAVGYRYRSEVDPRRALVVASWDRGRRRYAMRVLEDMELHGDFFFWNVDEVVAEVIGLVGIQEREIESVRLEVSGVTGSGYGPFHRSERPTYLPASARQASAVGEAYGYVERLSRAMSVLRGWDDRQIDVFMRVIMQLASGESRGTFGLPAETFPASTGWGVFSWQRELWHSTLEGWGESGPAAPWEATQWEEIEVPIRRYIELFEDLIDLTTLEWAAYGILLWHAKPPSYDRWLRRARSIGFARAEEELTDVNARTGVPIRRIVRRRLREAGIIIP